MKTLAFVLALAIVAALPAAQAFPECTAPTPGREVGPDPVPDECWVPIITYRRNLATSEDQPPIYVTRSMMLSDTAAMFDTRAELEAYIESGALRGLWEYDPLDCGPDVARCRWVPESAFEHVALRQIIDPPRSARARAR